MIRQFEVFFKIKIKPQRLCSSRKQNTPVCLAIPFLRKFYINEYGLSNQLTVTQIRYCTYSRKLACSLCLTRGNKNSAKLIDYGTVYGPHKQFPSYFEQFTNLIFYVNYIPFNVNATHFPLRC